MKRDKANGMTTVEIHRLPEAEEAWIKKANIHLNDAGDKLVISLSLIFHHPEAADYNGPTYHDSDCLAEVDVDDDVLLYRICHAKGVRACVQGLRGCRIGVIKDGCDDEFAAIVCPAGIMY